MTNRFTSLLLVAMLAMALAACATIPEATSDGGEPTEAAEASGPESAPESSPEESAESVEAEADETRVGIDGSAFDPEELTVPVGTEVVFLNVDGFEHTVTEGTDGRPVDDPIVDEEIAQNGTVSVTFDEAGTYDVTCRIHPTMHLTMTVEG